MQLQVEWCQRITGVSAECLISQLPLPASDKNQNHVSETTLLVFQQIKRHTDLQRPVIGDGRSGPWGQNVWLINYQTYFRSQVRSDFFYLLGWEVWVGGGGGGEGEIKNPLLYTSSQRIFGQRGLNFFKRKKVTHARFDNGKLHYFQFRSKWETKLLKGEVRANQKGSGCMALNVFPTRHCIRKGN